MFHDHKRFISQTIKRLKQTYKSESVSNRLSNKIVDVNAILGDP